MPRTARSTRFETAGALVLALGALGWFGLDTEQIECEEAFAHVMACCPEVEPVDVCGAGCTVVAISQEQSRCLRDLSCEQLREGGVCERFARLGEADSEVDAGAVDGGSGESGTCE